MKTNMEGTLWKWTNYFSGWQPRWFVLDGGILSYYKSQEDVNSGCKGSIKMTVCDVVVHQSDVTRLDLIIPGEQHFYVRAATTQERQLWLVALGTAKACATNGSTPTDAAGELTPDILRTKKSELRLYCDVLMQQVHAVKTAAVSAPSPQIEELDDATSLLSATCDTFIETLEDCMRLAHAKIAYQVPGPSVSISTVPPSPTRRKLSGSKNAVQRSASNDSFTGRPRRESQSSYSRQSSRSSVNSERAQSESPQPSPKPPLNPISDHNPSNNGRSHSGQNTEVSQTASTMSALHPESAHLPVNNNNNSLSVPSLIHSPAQNSEKSVEDLDISVSTPRVPTFFSSMSCSFMDIRLHEDGGIPVEPYLDSCRNLLPLFDYLHSTAFAPVKMDFTGNIRKIEQKYKSNPEEFTCLQKMVSREVAAKQYLHSSSATVALLWMKRGLEFIREMLKEIVEGQLDLGAAITAAYGRTLRRYHSWVVKGVFALAVKALPDHKTFKRKLAIQETDCDKPDFINSLMSDFDDYITALDVIIKILQDFYNANDLDNDEQV